jgi:hypothetical protein
LNSRAAAARDNRRAIPQGSRISPLLANLYMRRFVLGSKMPGLEQSVGSRIVTYADDLVILCRKGKAEEAPLHERMKLCILREFREPCIDNPKYLGAYRDRTWIGGNKPEWRWWR